MKKYSISNVRLKFFLVVTSFSVFMISCSPKNCDEIEGKVLQIYSTKTEVAKTYLIDHGASGTDVTLSICDKTKNTIIEMIGLRGEDYLPKIDSIVGKNIYIHYSFPKLETARTLKFSDVALGEALLNEKKLKYHYIVTNKPN